MTLKIDNINQVWSLLTLRDPSGLFILYIELKSIPEELSNYSNISLIARYSKKIRPIRINIGQISIFKNIFTYLISIFKSFGAFMDILIAKLLISYFYTTAIQ